MISDADRIQLAPRMLLCYSSRVLAGGLVSSRVVTPEQNMSPKVGPQTNATRKAFSSFLARTNPKSNLPSDPERAVVRNRQLICPATLRRRPQVKPRERALVSQPFS
jgi:hypothetical protein